nr:B3 domain-containing protein, DNA-binding pseudobarrel domain protein [Tanacetum cinerariifolium]
PRECPPQVTSTWFTKLPPDAKLWSKDISLAYTGPNTTSSSFIDDSEKLDLPQELIDTAKSFTLFLSPNDEALITKSSIINRTAVPIRLILPKKTKQPTCEDALAALVKQPVNKKKRTKRVACEQAESSHENEQLQTVCWDPLANQHNKPDKKKRKIPPNVDRGRVNKKNKIKRVECEEAESSHTNEQLQIVCWDPLANQHNEPDKKKMRIRPKVDCGPMVKNEMTERLQKFITDEMNGSDLKLVIQKVLYMSDLAPRQNRLNLPLKQLLTEDFLSDQERWILESDGEIKVRLVGPNLKMFKEPMELKIWDTTRTNNLVLTSKWKQFVEENKYYLKELSMIQICLRKYSTRKKMSIFAISTALDRRPVFSIVVEDDNDSMMINNSQAVLDSDEMKKNMVNEANDLMIPMLDSDLSLDMGWYLGIQQVVFGGRSMGDWEKGRVWGSIVPQRGAPIRSLMGIEAGLKIPLVIGFWDGDAALPQIRPVAIPTTLP